MSADVAVVAESLSITDSMFRQILDGLLQPVNFDARDREWLVLYAFCRSGVNIHSLHRVTSFHSTVLRIMFHVNLV